MKGRARLISVLTILGAGALGVIASTQTWFTVILADGSTETLAVTGAAAIAVLTPLSLAVLALGAALSIVGRLLRYLFGILTVVIGTGLLFATTQAAFFDRVNAVDSTVTEATGISGDNAMASLVSGVSLTPWPYVAVVVWVVLAVTGVFVLATAAQWSRGGRKYQTHTARNTPEGLPLDSIDSWDDLSRGDDPTAPPER